MSVAFMTAAALVHELMEACDEKRLRVLQKKLVNVKLLIIDELGYVPFTAVGAELLFEVFSRRYEHGATLVTSNLPFDEWTSVLGSDRLTGALLDRLTHHVHILEMNGESYRLATSRKRQKTNSAVQIHRGGYQTNINRYKCCWGVHCALQETPKNKKIRSAKPEAKSLFFINLTGTLLVCHLVHFHSAIDNCRRTRWIVLPRHAAHPFQPAVP